MLTREQIQAASDLLWTERREGRRIAALPASMRPETRAEGYAVQTRVETYSNSPRFGWKIAATSLAGQRHIGVDGPLAGRLIAEGVLTDGADVIFGANHMRVAEAEFAFRMGRDLEPRREPYRPHEVHAAIDALHLAIEVPDSRFEDFASVGAPQLIADCACAHLFVLGPAVGSRWRDTDLVAHRVEATAGSARHGGEGANVLGDPLAALTWLVNEVSGLGLTLKAGEVVTTGTCIVPIPISPPDVVVADFGVLGKVTARIV